MHARFPQPTSDAIPISSHALTFPVRESSPVDLITLHTTRFSRYPQHEFQIRFAAKPGLHDTLCLLSKPSSSLSRLGVLHGVQFKRGMESYLSSRSQCTLRGASCFHKTTHCASYVSLKLQSIPRVKWSYGTIYKCSWSYCQCAYSVQLGLCMSMSPQLERA